MKNLPLLLRFCFIFGCIAFLMSIGAYLALHDIRHDYVSRQVIQSYGGSIALNLPDWSETRLEWQVVHISELISIIYFIFSLIIFAVFLRSLRKRDNQFGL